MGTQERTGVGVDGAVAVEEDRSARGGETDVGRVGGGRGEDDGQVGRRFGLEDPRRGLPERGGQADGPPDGDATGDRARFVGRFRPDQSGHDGATLSVDRIDVGATDDDRAAGRGRDAGEQWCEVC